MKIERKTYESILKEYNDLRLENARLFQEKRSEIEGRVPELSEIENEMNSLRIQHAISRIRRDLSEDDGCFDKLSALKEKRNKLLSAAGYSLKDLEPVYTCMECKDTGFSGDKLCTCFRRRLIESLYDGSNIRNSLKTENFDTFSFKYYSDEVDPSEERSPKQAAEDAFSKARSFVRDFENSSDNLFISGSTGLGKTFLINCIAKELIEQGFSVIYLSSVRFFDILAENTFKRDSEDHSDAAGFIYDCDLLIIDDLGTEMVNSFVQSELFSCINERLLGKKHTIISTNLSLERLRNTYSERIFSRVLSGYKMIYLFGDDIRMKKKLEAYDAARRN